MIIFFRNVACLQIEEGKSDGEKHTQSSAKTIQIDYLYLELEGIEGATDTDFHTGFCCFHSLIILITSFLFIIVIALLLGAPSPLYLVLYT